MRRAVSASRRVRHDPTAPTLAAVLHDLMRRPNYTATPGLLGKLCGVPRATIINWLEGRVSKPRDWRDVLKVADALRLSDPETEALLEAAGHPPLADLRVDIPEPISADIARRAPHRSSPLPVMLTELLGRDDEVRAIRDLLVRDEVRLVSLIGSGGVGKTHLGIAVARSLHAEFPGGVVWIALAGVTDASLVLSKILHAVGIRETSTMPALNTLADALKNERVLLVVDNFEQVLTAAAQIGELLAQTLGVKVLVTSRAALRVRGEIDCRVAPLALPDLQNLPPPEALQHFAAVALFVKRAQAYTGAFALTPHNARAIATICARVDGLPLGLELAAARTNVLGLEDLLRRLDSRLTLLTSGARDADVRQLSLRNTIAWSYLLLCAPEQRLFRCLAVLVGGIGFAAAGALSGLDVERDLSVSNRLLERLASLTDQSLLSAIPAAGDGEPRFLMLETIREYAVELLTEHGELDAVRRLHAEHFCRLSIDADARFSAQPTLDWVQSLQAEYENIRATLQYFINDKVDLAQGARMVAALGRYWFERGLFGEGRRWLESVHAASFAIEASAGAKILLYLAFVANYESDYRTGAVSAREALQAYVQIGDRIGAAHARNALGVSAMYTGRFDEAHELISETLQAYRELDDRRGIAVALHNLGEIAADCRLDVSLAESYYGQSLAIFDELGHAMNAASTLGVLGELRARSGNFTEARRRGLEALTTFRRLDNQPLIAEQLTRLARYELALGDVETARSFLRGAVEHLKMSFHARYIAHCIEAFARLCVALEAYEDAATFIGFSEEMRSKHQLPRLPAWENDHAELTAAVAARLQPRDFAAWYARGRSLDLNAAFAQAVQR